VAKLRRNGLVQGWWKKQSLKVCTEACDRRGIWAGGDALFLRDRLVRWEFAPSSLLRPNEWRRWHEQLALEQAAAAAAAAEAVREAAALLLADGTATEAGAGQQPTAPAQHRVNELTEGVASKLSRHDTPDTSMQVTTDRHQPAAQVKIKAGKVDSAACVYSCAGQSTDATDQVAQEAERDGQGPDACAAVQHKSGTSQKGPTVPPKSDILARPEKASAQAQSSARTLARQKLPRLYFDRRLWQNKDPAAGAEEQQELDAGNKTGASDCPPDAEIDLAGSALSSTNVQPQEPIRKLAQKQVQQLYFGRRLWRIGDRAAEAELKDGDDGASATRLCAPSFLS
jgi:hypothetical protein